MTVALRLDTDSATLRFFPRVSTEQHVPKYLAAIGVIYGDAPDFAS